MTDAISPTRPLLPMVIRTVRVGTDTLSIEAAVDQNALLAATQGSALLPFGLMLWEAALLLARSLASADLAGRAVLELGAGVGLPALVAARQGAHVHATDVDPRALELAAANARRNALDGRITCCPLDWRRDTPAGRFDLILGADILYDRDDHAPIAHLLAASLAPGGRALLADPMRPHTPEFVQRLQDAGFSIVSTRGQIEDLTCPGKVVDICLIEARPP